MTQKIPTCKACGQPLVPTVKEIMAKLSVDEKAAEGLYDYLVNDLTEKLNEAESDGEAP